MYLMTQTKNGVSALELSRQLSVSYNTAWKVKHKLMQVMKERDDTRPLGGWVQLDDAYWGGQRRGGKTGRGAPGKTPFVAAVELNDEGRPMRLRLSRVGGFRSEEIAAWARCHLEPGTVVVSDALGCFAAVKHVGCIHQPFVTASGPQSAQHPALTWVNTILGNVKRSFHGTYHHFSSKHLPRYLAEFSYRFSRRFSLPEMFPPPRVRCPAHRAHAVPSAQAGRELLLSRMSLVRNQDPCCTTCTGIRIGLFGSMLSVRLRASFLPVCALDSTMALFRRQSTAWV